MLKLEAWGPFFEGPERFSRLESHGKMPTLMMTELVYSPTFNLNIEVLLIQDVSGAYIFLFLDADCLKMALRTRKGFRETGAKALYKSLCL